MAVPSPYITNNGVVSVAVKINGAPADATFIFTSAVIHSEVNRIPSARIRFIDGDITGREFPATEKDSIKPGNKIELLAGYGTNTSSLFQGIITAIHLTIDRDGASILELECYDNAIKMTTVRKNAYYLDKKDSDVLSDLAGQHGLSATVSSTTVSHKQLVQYYCSDWDFSLLRAEANGFIMVAGLGKLTIAAPTLSGTAVLNITPGDSILEMNLSLDARQQFAGAASYYWDPASQTLQTNNSSSATVNSQGDLDSKSLSSAVNSGDFLLQTAGLISADDAETWAAALMQKSWLSRIRGEIKTTGTSKANPGDLVQLSNVSSRFNGTAFVSSVYHEFEAGVWTTEFGLGLPYNWFAEQRDIEPPAAGGLLAPVQGLQMGVVTQIQDDPDGEFRVKVKLPLMQNDGDGIWVRLSTYYASGNAGNFFFPETNDEVIIGFMNNDPRHGVIIGSVYSSKNASPLKPDEKNSQKAIITKAQLKVLMDDENKIITVITPGENKIIISDKDKSIEITDQNSNTIKLNSDGILIDACKNVVIKAAQDIELQAGGNIKASATQDVKVSGLNIEESAQVKYAAAGQAQAELTAAGQLKIQGAIVMIN